MGSTLYRGGLACLVLLSASWAHSGTDASAVGPDRVAGRDRYATAVQVADRVLADGTPRTAVLVTGSNFPDGLVAGTWPVESIVLLTRTNALPWSALITLFRPEITDVVIVGGVAVVSSNVEQLVRLIGKPVKRLAGANRYLTSAAVVEQFDSVSSLWLAPGDSFVDQLNAIAAARLNDGVVALVPPGRGRASSVVRRYVPALSPGAEIHVIDSRRRVEDFSIEGHPVVVYDDSPFTMSAGLVNETSAGVVVASGDNWPDALTASRLATTDVPLVITRRECLPRPVKTALGTRNLTIVGGAMAVSDHVASGETCATDELPSRSDVSTCQVPDMRDTRNQPQSVGFPLTPDSPGTSSTGSIPIVVFPVDFPDAPGAQFDIDRMHASVVEATKWIAQESGGILSVEWRVSDEWIRLPRPSIEYDTPKGEDGYVAKAVAVASDIIALADPSVDFSGNPFVFFVFPSTLEDIDTDVGYFSADIATDEGRVAKFFGWGAFGNQVDPYGGGEMRHLWSFWIHEIGHTWGLVGHAPANVLGSNQLSPDLHIMDNQDGLVKILSAWDKFLLGWLTPRDVYCLEVDDVTDFSLEITARQMTIGGPQALMVRLETSKILVVESHRPLGFSQRLAPHPGGVVAYVVDTSIDNDRSGEGVSEARRRFAQYLPPDNPDGSPTSRARVQALIVPGGSASYGDLTLSVTAGSASGDTVRLSRIP